MNAVFKQIEVRGRKFNIDVDSQGFFNTQLDGDEISDKTFEGLKDKLAKATRQASARFSIPFVRWYDGKLKHGVITGRHISNKNLLIKWEGEKSISQEYPIYGGKYLSMTVGEAAEYVRLRKVEEAATKAADDFAEAHKFNALAAIDKLLKQQPEEES